MTRVAIALTALLGWLAVAPPAHAVDLEGAWHVLVHYRDEATAHPDRERWEDRVWIFERQGDRLRWRDYPIVELEDDSGRFERVGRRRVRTLQFWEPNARQLAQIESGVEVNPRGMKEKTLRGSPEKGWRSQGAPRAGSAAIVTYSETWSIEDPGGLPVFRREDFLATGLAEGAGGVTEYRTHEVSADGRVLRGTFERDGTRHGTFVMRRAGTPRKVRRGGATGIQRAVALLFAEAGPRLEGRERLRELVAQARGSGAPDDALRAAVRAEVRAALEAHLLAQGQEPRELAGPVESLAGQIERQILDEGRSLEDVTLMLEGGRLVP